MKGNKTCIERLYRYREALNKLKYLGCCKVFSDNLADAIGVTSSQVRKDFSVFGLSGNKKGGYVIDELMSKLDAILGKNKTKQIVVIGAGNIGTALMNYKGFESDRIKIAAAFDTDPAKINRDAPVPVLPFDELKDFLKEHREIKVGVMAVPGGVAQQVLDMAVAAGIRGVVNFAPTRLNIPNDFVIHSVNVGLELETVIYFVNSIEKQKRGAAHDPKA